MIVNWLYNAVFRSNLRINFIIQNYIRLFIKPLLLTDASREQRSFVLWSISMLDRHTAWLYFDWRCELLKGKSSLLVKRWQSSVWYLCLCNDLKRALGTAVVICNLPLQHLIVITYLRRLYSESYLRSNLGDSSNNSNT